VLFGQLGGSPGVWALPVDSKALAASGEPYLVAAGVSSPSVSRDGTLLLSTLTGTGQHQLSFVDLEGRIVKAVGEAVMHADSAVLAPDGKRLAVCLFEAKTASVWIYDLERGSRSRLWADIACGGKDAGIVWSPDGERLVTADHNSASILIRLADGSDKERVLTEGKQPNLSADGRYLLFSREDEENRKDLWMLDLEAGEPTPILATTASEEEPRISPDGRYLAYVSDESGRNEVYLRRFPEGSGRWQVSTEGGDFPRWSGSGDRLFFIQDADRIMVAEVELQATPVLGNPRLLFSATAGRFGPEHGYDVSPDGESLVMVALGGGSLAGGDLTLISPWPEASAED
jgi:Tol biopolymer transport system component